MWPSLRSTLLLGITLTASAHPHNQRRQDDQAAATGYSDEFQWQIWRACPDESRQAIQQAWEDSKRYGEAMARWVPKGDYQPAMDMYMGDRSTFQSVGDPGFDFPKQIQDTTRRYNGLFDGRSEYGHAYLWVYCNEDSFWFKHCTSDETSAVIAYEQEDNFFNNWYITFCPAFFDARYEVAMANVFQNIRDRNLDPTIMENYYHPGSQAAVWFHESMHLSQLVSSPQAVDYAYGPELVYDLARSSNTDRAVYNADSWTLVASAILAQQEFSLTNPPIPAKYGPEGASMASNGTGASLETFQVESDGNFVPEGAGSRAPNTPFYVDENLWEVIVRGSPAEPEPEPTPEPTPEPEPAPPVSYSCDGSSLCGSAPNLRRECDNAVNNLRRGGTYEYAASTDGVDEGNCSADSGSATACGVFLEGPADCKGQGDDLWNGYQEIRASGCDTCGYKSFTGAAGGECKLKIDYVSGCNFLG